MSQWSLWAGFPSGAGFQMERLSATINTDAVKHEESWRHVSWCRNNLRISDDICNNVIFAACYCRSMQSMRLLYIIYIDMQNFVELSSDLILAFVCFHLCGHCASNRGFPAGHHCEVLRSQCLMHVPWGSGSRCSERDVLEIRSCILESAEKLWTTLFLTLEVTFTAAK